MYISICVQNLLIRISLLSIEKPIFRGKTRATPLSSVPGFEVQGDIVMGIHFPVVSVSLFEIDLLDGEIFKRYLGFVLSIIEWG
jgi:hypothetical protein